MNKIEILRAEILNNQTPLYCTRKELCHAVDYAEIAIKEKQERENPQPLTLKELQEMGNQPVYLISLGEDFEDGWYICTNIDKQRAHFLQLYYLVFLKHYGQTWIAYRYSPKEATK